LVFLPIFFFFFKRVFPFSLTFFFGNTIVRSKKKRYKKYKEKRYTTQRESDN